jgi:hypothetical protein
MPVSLSPAAASMLKSKSTVIFIAHNGLVNARSSARSRPARRLISLRGTEDGAGGGRCRSCVSPPSLLQRTAHVGGMAIKKRRDLRIESKDDIRAAFSSNFYFGCEADDRTTLWAFDPRMGFRLRPVFSSDFTHFDVPDFREVIPEAFEMVEKGFDSILRSRLFLIAIPPT